MWHWRDMLPRRWRRQAIPIEVRHTRPESEGAAGSSAERALGELGSLFEDWFEPRGHFSPAVDVHDAHAAIELDIELPGLEAKDVELSITDDWLFVRGEKREATHGEERGARWSEIRYGAFERSIPLPPGLDTDASEAELVRGVLRVRLPRAAGTTTERRRIPVQPA